MLRTTDRQAAERLYPKAFEERLRLGTSSVPREYIVDTKTRFFLTDDDFLVAEVLWGDDEPMLYVFRHWTTQCPPSWVAARDGSVEHLWDEVRPQPSKKVRCVCKRCGKHKMEPATVDRTEPYLCRKCDDTFAAWRAEAIETADEDRRTLEHFLARSRSARY